MTGGLAQRQSRGLLITRLTSEAEYAKSPSFLSKFTRVGALHVTLVGNTRLVFPIYAERARRSHGFFWLSGPAGRVS